MGSLHRSLERHKTDLTSRIAVLEGEPETVLSIEAANQAVNEGCSIQVYS